MSPERSLESAVKRLIQTQPDFLPQNKRVSEKTLSNRTGSYSRVRTRLQRDAAECSAQRVSQSLIDGTASSWQGRRVYTVVAQDENSTTYSLTWQPSVKDRNSHPDLPAEATIEVRLHEIRIHAALTLCLVTSLPNSAQELSDLYHLRGEIDIETDIGNFKVVLNTEQIQARSVQMFRKELLTSLVADNLVTQFRRHAAALIHEPPRRMSFKQTWTTFNIFHWSCSATLNAGE